MDLIDRYSEIPFRAKLTAKTGSSPILYSWTEQQIATDGTLADATGGRVGTATDCAARELNNADIDLTTPKYVWMLMRGCASGFPVYEFQKDAAASSGLTVQEVDGTPSYTSITTIQVDQADGAVLTNPSAGVVRIDWASASATQKGMVDTTTQTWAGVKTFANITQFEFGWKLTTMDGDGSYVYDFGDAGAFGNAESGPGIHWYQQLDYQNSHIGPLLYHAYTYTSSTSSQGSLFLLEGTSKIGMRIRGFGATGAESTWTYFFVKDATATWNGQWATLPDGSVYKGGILATVGTIGYRSPPVSASSAGTPGQYATDGTWFYICTSANVWARVAIAGW